LFDEKSFFVNREKVSSFGERGEICWSDVATERGGRRDEGRKRGKEREYWRMGTE
jgi:hypothetical protein